MRDGAVAGADLNDFKCFQKSSKDFQRDFNRFQKVEQSYNHAEQWENSHQLGAVACPKRISSDAPVCVSVCVCVQIWDIWLHFCRYVCLSVRGASPEKNRDAKNREAKNRDTKNRDATN